MKTQITRTVLDKVAEEMDKHSQIHIAMPNTTAVFFYTATLWRTLARCIERGYGDGLNASDRDKKRLKGHGAPRLV